MFPHILFYICIFYFVSNFLNEQLVLICYTHGLSNNTTKLPNSVSNTRKKKKKTTVL